MPRGVLSAAGPVADGGPLKVRVWPANPVRGMTSPGGALSLLLARVGAIALLGGLVGLVVIGLFPPGGDGRR